MDASRRSSVWAFVVSVIAVALPLFACYAAEQCSGDDWEAMKTRTRSLLEQDDRRDRTRPVLRGRPVSGNAWEDYESALRQIKGIKPTALGSAIHDKHSPEEERRSARVQLLSRYGPSLDPLRKGTGRSWSRAPAGSVPGESLYSYGSELLIQLGICRCLELQQGAQAREAAELLLDLCQFARDHEGWQRERLIREPLEFLKNLLASRALNREDLLEVERELQVLEMAYPPYSRTLLNHLASMGSILGNEEADLSPLLERTGIAPGPASWVQRLQYGRKSRVLAFQAVDRWATRFARLSEGPWEQEHQAGEERISEQYRDGDLAEAAMPGARDGFKEREVLAQLRLLRIAAHFRATGDLVELADPFGGMLSAEVSEGKLRAWSRGADGDGASTRKGWRGWNAVEGILLEVSR